MLCYVLQTAVDTSVFSELGLFSKTKVGIRTQLQYGPDKVILSERVTQNKNLCACCACVCALSDPIWTHA